MPAICIPPSEESGLEQLLASERGVLWPGTLLLSSHKGLAQESRLESPEAIYWLDVREMSCPWATLVVRFCPQECWVLDSDELAQSDLLSGISKVR